MQKLVKQEEQETICNIKVNPILRIYRKLRARYYPLGKWYERHCAPRHVVVETDECVYIDKKRISHVLVPDGVKVERLSSEQVLITLKFAAKSYRRIT